MCAHLRVEYKETETGCGEMLRIVLASFCRSGTWRFGASPQAVLSASEQSDDPCRFKVGEDKHSSNLELTSDRGDCNLESDTVSNSHRPVLVECFSPSFP